MGADLIGYFLLIPPDWKKRKAKHIEFLEGAFEALDVEMAKGVEEIPEAAWKALAARGVDTYTYQDLREVMGSDQELVDHMKSDFELAKAYIPGRSHRDLAERQVIIKGKKFTMQFAGEMSWGDEPEGYGYTELKAMCLLGFDVVFEGGIQ